MLLLCLPVMMQAGPPWRVTRSEHFEVYAQSDDASARRILLEFEQLRALFQEQTALNLNQLARVRVIVFGSVKDYEPYRLGPTADAYFAGAEGRNYIVMAFPGAGHFGMAAHEYAHLILHALGTSYPPWLDEGLAEFFSTIRTGEHATEVGAALPGRLQTLQRRGWMPLRELVTLAGDAPERQERASAELFYAQSWALTGMLLRSPQYAAGFQRVLAAIASGEASLEALTRVYEKSADEITRDLEAWTERRAMAPVQLPAIGLGSVPVEVAGVAPVTWRFLMAEVMLAAGALDRAEMLYRDLKREASGVGDAAAALGTIALRWGDPGTARTEWKQAIAEGVTDASICYRYALLAEQAGAAPEEVRGALARAVELQPDFDDARYSLALLEKSSGDYRKAVADLRAMKSVGRGRAYGYWIAMADSLNELGAREEAKAAAREAEQQATTAAERSHAAQLAYIAETDLGVQFARDANGRAHMVTTRVPHAASNWNPFIEAGDDLRRAEGTLRDIECSGDVIWFVIQTPAGVLRLGVQDPSRVQIRNGPPDFVCGPQPEATAVKVEYAVSREGSAVRGIEFR